MEAFGELLGDAGIAEALHFCLFRIIFRNAFDDILAVIRADRIGLNGRDFVGQPCEHFGIELPSTGRPCNASNPAMALVRLSPKYPSITPGDAPARSRST